MWLPILVIVLCCIVPPRWPEPRWPEYVRRFGGQGLGL